MTKNILLTFYFHELFNDINIAQALNNGEANNFKYYKYEVAEKYFEAPEIDHKEILERIRTHNENAPVLCKFEDTGFFLYFNTYKNNSLKIALGCTNYPWKKDFQNGIQESEFDIQRYIRLMLTLAKGLQIYKIEAKIEWE